jgi:hypothetical protein
MLDRDTAKVKFPWIAYLSQPIGHPTATLIVNPTKFKRLYRIWSLENCLRLELTVSNCSR